MTIKTSDNMSAAQLERFSACSQIRDTLASAIVDSKHIRVYFVFSVGQRETGPSTFARYIPISRQAAAEMAVLVGAEGEIGEKAWGLHGSFWSCEGTRFPSDDTTLTFKNR